ncbi:MAG: ABC transporter permease subunit, partial [Spirochaetales bacterium]|nr:ABC transporter permease subunit [Spirochaetales bacterium]
MHHPHHMLPSNKSGIVGIALTVLYVGLLIVLPFGGIIAGALEGGLGAFARNVARRETLQALGLSASVTTAVLLVNVVFGVASAWLIAKFRFPGRTLILSLLNLPLSISPVIVGLLFILLLGRNSALGGLLESVGVRIIFAWPGLFLVTLFISFPYIVRELLPVLSDLGSEDEEAAITLGASGFATFFRVTVPNIRLALLYGITLAAARA